MCVTANMAVLSLLSVAVSGCGSDRDFAVYDCNAGKEFATVGRDNTVRIWNAISGNQVRP
jgi:WD40 repeat protein